jgi:hypothetical protein
MNHHSQSGVKTYLLRIKHNSKPNNGINSNLLNVAALSNVILYVTLLYFAYKSWSVLILKNAETIVSGRMFKYSFVLQIWMP